MLEWLFESPLRPGTPAPDFTLPDQDGVQHSLSKLAGRNVVLVFYPADETATCRKQLCELRDRADRFALRNAAILGINPQTAEKHARFRNSMRLQFPLLVDECKRVARLYHCAGPVLRRTVYVIGADGRIRFSARGKPSPEVLLQTLER